MINRRDSCNKIIESGVIAVFRFKEVFPMIPVADALIRGGIMVLEITLTTPEALSSIEALKRHYGSKILIGAGSLISRDQVEKVASAGADFIVSPITRNELIDAGHAYDLPILLGAFTPTEAQTAHEYGADMVKIFPAGQTGPSYLRGLLAPMPHLKLVPTGGVTPENAGEWIHAGAVAVGIGTALIDTEAIRRGTFSVLTERARTLCSCIAKAKNSEIHHGSEY